MTKRYFILIFIFSLSSVSFGQSSYENDITKQAGLFLGTLTELQKKSALVSFNDTARIQWNNLPVGLRARAGINIGNMDENQRRILHRMLSAALSSQGYLKATGIMHLDNLINWYYDTLYYRKAISENVHEQLKKLEWSHRNFYLAFFGLPQDSCWAFKLEGHHLSINFTFKNKQLAVTPFFVGTDPAEYTVGDHSGWRVLGQEQDLGLLLIHKLSPDQQKKATQPGKVPGDIITAAESGKRLIDYWGLPASEMNAEQQLILKHIVREFVFNLEYEKASDEYEKILKAGIEKIHFGWIGPYEENKAHYFVLNGPSFLIEFDDNGFGDNANHIHAIWREKGNDFGEDILKTHYQQQPHKR